jgi:N6-adenosine-specific RNA methylase IME4
MGRPRLYADERTQWRERKRRQRKAKKRAAQPYYAKRAEMRQQLEALATHTLKAAQGVYDVVVIDPPWPVAFQAREARPQQVALAYPTMSVTEIQALRLPLADVAYVWLWTTQRFLLEAGACLAAWGLTYSCCFVWRKPGGMQPLGLPQLDCEFALYARKSAALLLETRGLKTSFDAPRTEHSAKPEAFYAMVRRITAGRRLDMFARRPIAGFESWGYEAPRNGDAPGLAADGVSGTGARVGGSGRLSPTRARERRVL